MTRKILVDVDGVLADLHAAICRDLTWAGFVYMSGEGWTVPWTPEHATHYEFERCFPPEECNAIHHIMANPGFCTSIPWYPAARTFVEALQTVGEVIAVTKPYPKGPQWAYERKAWLQPYIKKVVHTDHKELVGGDILIEDYPSNCITWLAHNPDGLAILLSRPWNQDVQVGGNIVRAATYANAVWFACTRLADHLSLDVRMREADMFPWPEKDLSTNTTQNRGIHNENSNRSP